MGRISSSTQSPRAPQNDLPAAMRPLFLPLPQISPERIRLNTPVARVQWAQEGVEGEGEGEAPSSAKSHRDSHPCVVEYTTRKRSSGGEGVGGGKEETCTRRIRCRRVVVTVGLGVLKVRGVGLLPSCFRLRPLLSSSGCCRQNSFNRARRPGRRFFVWIAVCSLRNLTSLQPSIYSSVPEALASLVNRNWSESHATAMCIFVCCRSRSAR